jgi:hypothetical protein
VRIRAKEEDMGRWFVVAFVVAAVALLALFWGGTLLPRSWFYQQRRPTRFGRLVNSATAWLFGTLPLPGSQVSLETRGRRTGRVHAIPVVIGEYEGERYLVSMLGERSGWVPNIRAAGGRAVIKRGRRQAVSLETVPVDERAPIIKAYLRRAPGARPHIKLSPDDPIEAFERIAHEYPVFRIAPASPR